MIKFRGIPLEDVNGIGRIDFDGTFVYGNYVKNGDGALIVGDKTKELDDVGLSRWFVNVVLETVGQFTGLKDVNDKDIYEGDIIEYSHQFYEGLITGAVGCETGYIGKVTKKDGAFGILISRVSYTDAHNDYYHTNDFVPFCEFDDPEADMVLKGNVHTNPEILETNERGRSLRIALDNLRKSGGK